MAVVDLVPQEITKLGVAPTYTGSLVVSPTNTYTVANDGRVMLHVKKTGAGACTVTVTTPGTVDGNAIADTTFSVPATTGDRMAGPWRPETYNDPATGLMTIGFSEITGLTIAVVRLP